MSRSDEVQLGQLCAELPTLRTMARAEGWSSLLERTEMALRAGTAPAAVVMAELWDQLGFFGVRRGGSGIVELRGQEPVPPPDGSYRCPAPPPRQLCSRIVVRRPGEPLPECPLHGLPLRFVQ
jgi:hypothetical protein